MITKIWWIPFSSACLLFIVLGQWQKPATTSSGNSAGPDSLNLVSKQGEETGDSEAHSDSETEEDEDDLPPLTDPDLFVDWDTPEFAIFVSGRLHGYIEPCGCTGLDYQKGGMMRRHTLMMDLQAKGWQLLPIDAGNQIKRFGVQPGLKMDTTYKVMCEIMDYQAIGFGPDDLKLSSTEIVSKLVNYKTDNDNPFVSANVVLLDQEFTERIRFFEIAGKKVSVTSVLGDEFHEKVQTDDIFITKVDEAVNSLLPTIEAEKCDYNILMAFTSLEETTRIANDHPHFDIIVTCGGAGEPTRVPELVKNDKHTTRIIQVGTKGMYVGVLGIFDDEKNEIRYQRIPLDRRFKDSEKVMDLFIEYQENLQNLGLAGLGISANAHPSGRQYVGSEACYDCHDVEWEIWRHGIERDESKVGPHWRATLDLTEPSERAMVPRHHDPECLSCHVTGWNPQRYFPYISGYLELEKDTDLHANGCENCHGPGKDHVDAENEGWDDAEKYQLQMRVTLEEAKESLCIECHDLDNSPDFHEPGAFEKYWAKIKHGGSAE